MARSIGRKCFFLVVMAVACGGRTENSGTGGAGGASGSGGHGAFGGGGSGAHAGGGAGGALGGGGSGAFGGSGAVGGSGAMGGGGSGAFGGSGANGGVGGWDAKIDALCDKIAKLPCPMPDCYGELAQSVKDSISLGCDGPMASLLDCALSHPIYCQGGEPQVAIDCQKLMDQFEQCAQSNQCQEWAASDGSCGTDCQDWGAQCKPSPDGMGVVCTCTYGPAAGAKTKASGNCGTQAWQNAVETTCS